MDETWIKLEVACGDTAQDLASGKTKLSKLRFLV